METVRTEITVKSLTIQSSQRAPWRALVAHLSRCRALGLRALPVRRRMGVWVGGRGRLCAFAFSGSIAKTPGRG
jgi:hypothetical protein